ncbi:MAG: type II toxin-antitoxin system RelE/ParE family toxin [Chloroflexi bacterium]|nr:type II toxin-antitoxin system RelE/ParE family toxin [Chloroflexota bacterium]MBI3740229.1 type II toxin-antitoxin system RelE/ParE family toxin [Chloroflexota bacterium]
MYEIEFTDEAEEDLRWFRKDNRQEILDNIETQLSYEPTVETRNRFRTRPNQTAEWELRIGKFRVFYDVDNVVRIVSIEAVGLKLGNRLFFRGKEREL